MNKKVEIVSAVLGLTIAVVGFIFWYPKYQAKKVAREALVVADKVRELDKLILKDRDCARVMEISASFLKTRPGAIEIWHLQGACEFDLGKFDEARASFEKVLTLNPNHEAAKNYMERLNPKPGEIVVTGPVAILSRTDFESAIGFELGEKDWQFVQAEKRTGPDSSEHFSAVYTSTESYGRAVSLLKSALEKTTAKFTTPVTDGATVFAIAFETEQKTLTVINNSPVQLVVKYLKI